jgi:UDP-glucose 4-epimerase
VTERRLAISAASSFTGLWITRELLSRGWKVLPVCSEKRESYSGLRAERVRLLEEATDVHFGVRAESGAMAAWIRKHRPEIWVHHHHFMENFRGADYDFQRALQVGLEPLKEIVLALKESGCRGIIYSGTYFEPGLGSLDPAFQGTPYSKSKKLVWEALQEKAGKASIPLSKFVNPNPIGPFENDDRLIPALIRNSLQGKSMVLKTPSVLGDQLPIPPLVESYDHLASALLSGQAKVSSPSGWVVSVIDFVNEVNEELIRKRLGLKPCVVDSGPLSDKLSGFRNSEQEKVEIAWSQVWDHYSEWLTKTNALSRFFS